MVRSERGQLIGSVEVDETLVGGVEQGGKRGCGSSKNIVVIAVELKQSKGFGHVRVRHVPDVSGSSLLPFVRDVVMHGASASTDGGNGTTYSIGWR